MLDQFDRNETRSWKTREAVTFRDFKAIISIAKSHASLLRKQMRGVDIARIKRREDLAQVPVIRRADLAHATASEPPYGGVLASRPGFMRHLLPTSAAGHARDWWNAARAMHAAGFAKNDIILNCASYHMNYGGHLVDSGASSLGCAVIPAGPAETDRLLEAIRRHTPNAYCGKPGVLRRILEQAAATNIDISLLKKALVFGAPLSTHFRRECEARGLRVRHAYTCPEIGVVAFETSALDGGFNEGMIVNEGVILEIVHPDTNEPVTPGQVGEIVVTRLNVDFPLLRFGTGDLSRIISGASPCGRTNTRIQGWMGRVEETVRFRDQVLPSQVLAMGARHACVQQMRLVFSGDAHKEESILRVEGPDDDPQLPINLKATMKSVLGFEARIDIVRPGMLPRDGKLIADERPRA